MMKLWYVFLLVVLVAWVRPAPSGEEQGANVELKEEAFLNLWPGKAPGALGETPEDTPAVQVFLPKAGTATGASFIVCPGGGYGGRAGHEGAPVAKWFAANGITGFVLRYRVGPRYHHPIELGDAQRAVRFVRAHAAAWKLDPARIGILGFSAGGHLASSAATHFDDGAAQAADPVDKVSCRPDLQVLVYPVITLSGPDAHGGSRDNLLGKNAPPELIELLSNQKQVTAKTPPAFLVHSTKDTGVPPSNSDKYAEALKAAGVPYEYVREDMGGHGFGLKDTWTKPCEKWLRENKFGAAN